MYERLSDFRTRIINQFPDAELTKTLDEPPQEVLDSPCQRKLFELPHKVLNFSRILIRGFERSVVVIQINQVSPVEDKKLFGGRTDIDPKIVNYYRHNEVDKFMYSRIERNSKGATSKNEFAQLWKDNFFLVTRDKLPGMSP